MNHDIIASNRGLLWRRMPTKHRYQGKDETALSAEATREKKKKKIPTAREWTRLKGDK